MIISAQLKNAISQTLVGYHRSLMSPRLSGELDYIRRTTSFFANRFVPVGQQSFTTRARSIDKSPRVVFCHTTPWENPAPREIADLLIVSKLKRGNKVIGKRAVILQSKFTRNNQSVWHGIDTAQFYLILKWPTFIRISPRPMKAYKLNPQSRWGNYVFVGSGMLNYPVYFTSSSIYKKTPRVLSQKSFTFNLKRSYGCVTSPCFLMRQALCLTGEDLLANPSIQLFVDDMFQIVGLKPDPPDEFYWDSTHREEELNGFGVVEFVLSISEAE